MTSTTKSTEHNFVAATEPPDGWPERPWDHWIMRDSGQRRRVAVDARGEAVRDGDGDEVMSGPGFKYEVVKVLPLPGEPPPEQPDPRSLVGPENRELLELLNSSLDMAAFFGHPWVGDEHLGLVLAARGEFPGVEYGRLEAATAAFYEGPWAERRVAIVRERRAGRAFVRQPEQNLSWTRALYLTLENAGSTTPADLSAELLSKDRSLISSLLSK